MSRTYRLIGYKKGKPLYTKNINKYPPYRYYRHEHPIARRKLWRAYRHKCKVYLRKYNFIPKWYNTMGWNTW